MLLTANQLAERLIPRYSVRHLQLLASKGVIPRVQKVGRRWLYDFEAVQTALLNYQPETPEAKKIEHESDPLYGC